VGSREDAGVLRRITPDHISREQLVRELRTRPWTSGAVETRDHASQGRTGMLTTGIRTPIGWKIAGGDVATIDRIGASVETILSRVAGARRVFAERARRDDSWTSPGTARRSRATG